jgi:polyhydroxyalkanoate synthesis regulator phasin
MAKDAHDSGVTTAQRQEIRRLCQQASVPDKSGEMFTQESAQRFIDDMRRKVKEQAGTS